MEAQEVPMAEERKVVVRRVRVRREERIVEGGERKVR